MNNFIVNFFILSISFLRQKKHTYKNYLLKASFDKHWDYTTINNTERFFAKKEPYLYQNYEILSTQSLDFPE